MSPRFSGPARLLPAALVAAALVAAPDAHAQTFARITDPTNPIVTQGGSTLGYTGASWVDVDGDGDDDLFVTTVGLFRNLGGTFALVPDALPNQGNAKGHSWADIDNDGDLDAFVAGGLVFPGSGDPSNGSAMYRNDGTGFVKLTGGALGDTLGNAAWGCAFGDYDRDGRVDLVTAAAFNFIGINVPNRLLHNEGGGSFARVDTAAMAIGTAPYTIPTWSDYDGDGDPDLFIGAGPASGALARDYLYTNRNESAAGWFQRINAAPLGTDLQDGQVYNWIDYDSDGDLDVFLTNYAGSAANRLYRNNGNSTFTAVTTAGTIVTENFPSLASVWQDFDNDGDLDCVVTNDSSAPTRFHRNNGDGTFTLVTIAGLTVAGPHYGAASGDWDDDGDMDLFVSGPSGLHGLFRNTTATTNGWLKVRLTGTVSNRAAIGAKVRLRATIGGVSRRLVREISAQNTFGGQNSLVAHFGLGNAATVDSVLVEWPSGLVSVLTSVAPNSRLHVVEDGPTATQVALARAEAGAGRVTVHWILQGTFDPRVGIERRAPEEEWTSYGGASMDPAGNLVWEDPAVEAGGTYGYRLRVVDGGETLTVGEVWATVPAAAAFGIRAISPNPSPGALRVTFAVPRRAPATLEVFDLGGRRVASRAIADPAPGVHTESFGTGRRLSAGVYLVRLSQSGQRDTGRVVVIE